MAPVCGSYAGAPYDREVGWEEVVRGYEYAKDHHVVLTEEDFEKLPLPSKNTIEISAFVDVRIALVGHSLGGLIAALGMSHPSVKWVVTLDSPLMGLGSRKILAGKLNFTCAQNFVALDQLSAMQADSQWPDKMARAVDDFHQRGGRIATLGNEDDCLYDPALCPLWCGFILCPFFVDETFTQVIENADTATLCGLGTGDGSGHSVILENLDTARYIASFISGQLTQSTPVC